jgi:anti-sigma factor RsiW
MSGNLKDILSNLQTGVDQEILMRYLQGKLSAEEQYEVEKHLVDSQFEADAVEGLQQMKDNQQMELLLAQLQQDLKKKTSKKKAFQDKLRIKEQPLLWAAILILLLLVVISFFIIQKLVQK